MSYGTEGGFAQLTDDETSVDITDAREQMPGLAGYIQNKFEDSENGRRSFEQRWLTAYKNFRGYYDSSTQYRESERSRVFIKITKTKVLAAYGAIVDILFANKKFPIVVEPTPVPEGIAEFAHAPSPIDELIDPFGYPGDGRELEPGATRLGPYEATGAVEGPSKDGGPQVEPASESARLLEKTMHDQLLDTNAVNVLRNAVFESALLGTGIIKGPLNYYKKVHRWSREGEERMYDPMEKVVPRFEYVSCWDFHPDPSATSIDDCEYVIQRHRLNRQQLRNLTNLPYFNEEAIAEVIVKGPNYEDKYYEDTIREDETEPYYQENRYEVLEYWGVLDSKFAYEVGLDLPENISELDQVQVNAWVCGTQVLRCVLNPFTPARIPFFAFPYEINPYQIWGVGVAENMEDAQMLMNGHVRMAIDNLALAGNLVFDIDERRLDRAKSFGASNLGIDINKNNISNEFTNNHGFDVVIDAACTSETFEKSIQFCAKGGTVVTLGFAKQISKISQYYITKNELNIVGSRLHNNKFETVLRWVENSKINLDGFVTHRFHYTEINDAMSMLLTPYNDICKAVIDFN